MRVGNIIYLDHQATTPVDKRVFEAMAPYFCEQFGNPHSVDHIIGWNSALAVENAKSNVAELIGCDTDEIIFTSGATESNNLALMGIARHSFLGGKKRILISTIEHKSILEVGRALQEKYNYVVEFIPVDKSGFVELDALEARVDGDVLLISVMAVNNEIGTIQSLEQISAICRKYGAIFHSDCAQAPCAMTLTNLSNLVDMLSISAHKIYGPKGIGALFVNRDLVNKLEPLIYGGEQQSGIRSGTVPVPLCVGMGEAIRILLETDAGNERERIQTLRNRLFEGLSGLPYMIKVNGPVNEHRHPGNLNLAFKGFEADDILGILRPNLAVSTGSACTTGTLENSHVLDAIGIPENILNSSLRFSVGRFTTEEDIDITIELINQALSKLSHLNADGSEFNGQNMKQSYAF